MKAFKRLNSIVDDSKNSYELDHSLLKKREEIQFFESIQSLKNNKASL